MKVGNQWFSVMLVLASSMASVAMAEGVCDRTGAVVRFLESPAGEGGLGKPCAEITEDDLATLTRVAVPDEDVSAFKVGDFAGLPNLEILNIKGNPFTELPEGLFKGLPKLKTLVIFRTKLRHLPDDFLVGLDQLENLHIFSNPFGSISESVFQRLAAIHTLQVLDFNKALQQPERTRLEQLFPATGLVSLNFY